MRFPQPKNKEKLLALSRKRRRKRTRMKIKGTKLKPRLSVFRSLKHIYAQLIDDEKGRALIVANDRELHLKTKKSLKELKDLTAKQFIAYKLGELLAKKALAKKIKNVVFDKGWYKYHGRVKALAEGARSGGLKF